MRLAARKVARILAAAKQDPNGTDWIKVADKCLLLLALPKRKVRPRDPARSARRVTVKELDALCRKIVFARDEGKCQWPGCVQTEGRMDWAHFISRRHKAIRWALDNSAVLCRAHHMRFHEDVGAAHEFIRGRIGLDKWKDLATRARNKTDLSTVRYALEWEAKAHGVKVDE